MLTTLLTLALTQTGSIQTEYIKTHTPTMIVSHFEREDTEHINIFQSKKEQPQEKTTEPTLQTQTEPTSQEPPTTYTFQTNNYTYTYDLLGRQLTQTDAGSKTTTYTYNTTGSVATKTDANGTVTTYTYD
jgi:YD repeat-containing protein